MPATTIQRAVSGTVLCAWLALMPLQTTLACTRAVYFGQDAQTITGRSMDWVDDMQSNLYLFPRGLARDGGLGQQSLQWTSK